eukprot:5669295-Alexandrium_andersonii.AAC.1
MCQRRRAHARVCTCATRHSASPAPCSASLLRVFIESGAHQRSLGASVPGARAAMRTPVARAARPCLESGTRQRTRSARPCLDARSTC